MRKLRFTILFVMLMAVSAAWAQAKLTLQAPRQAIEGKNFTITLRVSNGHGSAPQAPQLEGCALIYGPSVSTMHSTQIVNGQVTQNSTTDYTFTYRAERAGTVRVPSISMVVDGKQLSAQPATITILPPDSRPQAGAGASGGNSNTPRPGNPSEASTPISPDDMFVRVTLNKHKVYEQEAVVATVKVYTVLNISSFRATVLPTFEGFLSEELSVPEESQMEHYNGRNYMTAVLKRCILYPQKTGQLTINSGKYEVTVEQYEKVSTGWFVTQRPVSRQVNTQSNQVTLTVMPLPEPRPADFSGAVGQFTANVELSPLELRTNEAASYIYAIQGTGNIKYLKTPTLNIPAGIDQFTPKTESDATFTGNDMRGSFTVNYTLLPQEPGNFKIPASHFCYFNPSDNEYHTIDLPGFDMRVAQGASTSTLTEQKAISRGMQDIYHIKPVFKQVTAPLYIFRTFWYWLMYAAAALTLLAVILVYRRQLKLNADVRGRKLAKANKVATRRLKSARAAMDRDSDRFYAELNKALWGYISDKLGMPSSQLTRDNIATELTNHGFDQPSTDEVIDVLDRCEMARFAPTHTEDEISKLYDDAVRAVNNIEKNAK